MRGGRFIAAILGAALAGLTVAGLVGIPRLSGPANVSDFLANGFFFWGILFGSLAAIVTFGLLLALLHRKPKSSVWGRRIAGVSLALLSLATFSWIVTWGFSPFTLEGMWIYPLALTSGGAAVLLLRRRRYRGPWDEPPAARS